MNTEPPLLKKPDPKCPHSTFSAQVNCHRFAPSGSPNGFAHGFVAEIHVKCDQCGGDFMFEGLPWAISTERPCLNVSRTQATIPMKPWDGMLATGTCRVDFPKSK